MTAIAAGYWHSLFIKNDGSFWVMGQNTYGQLGDGTGNNTNQPKRIVSNGVAAIAGGYGHSLFLKTNGSLWAMGYNTLGQLGDGSNVNTNRPKLIVTNDNSQIANVFDLTALGAGASSSAACAGQATDHEPELGRSWAIERVRRTGRRRGSPAG